MTHDAFVKEFAQRIQRKIRFGIPIKSKKCGNLFFEENILYSYGHHYKVAELVYFNDRHFVLLNDCMYSSSTSHHQRIVRSVFYYENPIFTIIRFQDLDYSVEKSLKNEARILSDLAENLSKQKKLTNAFVYRCEAYIKAAKNLKSLSQTLGLPAPKFTKAKVPWKRVIAKMVVNRIRESL